MSILSGKEILRQVELGHIGIDPFVREHVNPASVDLTLGNKVAEYENSNFESPLFMKLAGFRDNRLAVHDVKKKQKVHVEEADDSGFLLLPGHLYLMHTAERVWTEKFVSELTGKSSIARLGLVVHLTAGFIDCGFRGQITLEVVTFRAVRLYAGMRICQLVYHTVLGEAENYQERGHYTGDQRGPVPSMVHKQFEGK